MCQESVEENSRARPITENKGDESNGCCHDPKRLLVKQQHGSR